MRPIRRVLAVLSAATLLPLGLAGAAQAAPAPALPLLAAAPTPQGPLVSTACSGTGTVTCELFAKTGTTTVVGTSVPIWGFASTDAAPVTAPGPVLVVTQGDTVTVNLHNGLTSPLSLAVPNLTGPAPDTAGAAAGATKPYTFTAGRPGTYLYEAGHTADGARQAAMGLVGAMIVRPTAAGSAYGDAPSAFDDEAALVLSEIDPAFNANPAGFDMRNYHPTLKLINGKAFPETDPIATAIGHKVLLRYVNAGSVDHAMGVAGTRQTVVGADARPNADAFPLFADTIPPGQTEEAVVAAPTAADGAKFVVYETAGRLDNAGARVGTTTGVAFGGMMTYLTTDAVPPTTDTFGPVTSTVTLAPTSVKATQPVTLTANLTDVPNGNSNVTAAEYVLDNPGSVAVGTGTPLTGAFGTPIVTGATATLTPAVLQTLAQGTHTVYVRAQDSAGNWGPVSSATFALTVTGPTTTAVAVAPAVTNGTVDVALSATGDDTGLGGTVTAAEYFIGAAGASGAGTAMTLTAGTVAAETATIPAQTVTALAAGAVPIYVHSKDSFGLWGPQVPVTLTVNKTGPTASGLVIDPNPTDGTVGTATDPTQLKVSGTFTEVGNAVVSPIAGAEGFLETPGANGTGFVFLAADGRFDTATEAAYGLIPLSQVTGLANGPHTVYVHGKDAAGNWGALSTVTLTVDHGVVVSGLVATLTPNTPTVVATTTGIALRATATSPNGAPLAAEWFADADPGAGSGRPVQIVAGTPAGTYTLTASVPPGGLAVGAHTLSVRAKSPAGTWGKPVFVTVNVDALSTFLFADGFDSGGTANWAGQTGAVTVVAPGAAGPNQMQAAAAGTAAAQIVDTTPLGEARYRASFAFTANSLTAGAGTVNVFQALTAANGEVFTVQYQKQGTGYRVRLVRGATASPWLNVAGTTVRTLAVTWATTATTSTAALTVTGVAGTSTLTGGRATATLRVDTVRMGLSGGPAATTGSALFDTFTSSRT